MKRLEDCHTHAELAEHSRERARATAEKRELQRLEKERKLRAQNYKRVKAAVDEAFGTTSKEDYAKAAAFFIKQANDAREKERAEAEAYRNSPAGIAAAI